MSRVLAFLIALLTVPYAAASDSPLLDYAAQLSFTTMPYEAQLRQQLSHISYEIGRNPPPERDCARTLGAARFASLFDELGAVRAGIGDHAGAVEAFTKAIECNPRAAYLHAQLASELLHLGRYAEARAAAQRGLAIQQDHVALHSILAQLDFIEERWTDAIVRLREAVRLAEDDERATYYQCFLWLAQRHAGISNPRLAERSTVDGWPSPILETLQGRRTEQELLETIEDEQRETRRREILSEALYYIGQQHLAEGRLNAARRHFAAAVNLKVLYFIEHYMALAELAKLRMQAADQSQHGN